MDNQGIVFFYCVFAVAICALGLKFLKTVWVYFLVSTLLPPMLLIGGDAAWHGRFSVWDDIVFIVLALIAFGIALVLFVARFVWLRTRQPQQPSDSTSQR